MTDTRPGRGKYVAGAGAAACAVCCAAPVLGLLGIAGAGAAATVATFAFAGLIFALVLAFVTAATITLRRRRHVPTVGACSQPPLAPLELGHTRRRQSP